MGLVAMGSGPGPPDLELQIWEDQESSLMFCVSCPGLLGLSGLCTHPLALRFAASLPGAGADLQEHLGCHHRSSRIV